MKKHFSLVMTLALLVVVSFGCKVGAEDPASLGSRDGRLLAEWKLVKVAGTDIDTDFFGTVTTTTSTYDGTLFTQTSTPGGANSFSYALDYTFEKGGILTAKQTTDGVLVNESTDWEWLATDKKKSEVLLNSSTRFGGIWSVLRLSGDELILEQNNSFVATNNGSTNTSSSTWKLTFEAE